MKGSPSFICHWSDVPLTGQHPEGSCMGLLGEQVWDRGPAWACPVPPGASAGRGRGRDVVWGSLPCVTSFSVSPRCPGTGADGQVRLVETFRKTDHSCLYPDSQLDSQGLWPCGAVSTPKLWGKLMQKGWGNFQPRLTLPTSSGSFPPSFLVPDARTGVRTQT